MSEREREKKGKKCLESQDPQELEAQSTVHKLIWSGWFVLTL